MWPPAGGGGGVGSTTAGGSVPRGGTSPWGGSLGALDALQPSADEAWPQTEAELARHYHHHIMDEKQRHLEPLSEDLAEWLNHVLGKSDHFLTRLSPSRLSSSVITITPSPSSPLSPSP